MKKSEFLKKLLPGMSDSFSYHDVPEVFDWKNPKIPIHCKICGSSFSQNFYSHLAGRGCKKCQYINQSSNTRLSNEEFIRRATEVHGDIFNYATTNYQGYFKQVSIKCCQCNNIFSQLPANHLDGHGCSNEVCRNLKISTSKSTNFDEFLAESVSVFGVDAFEYSGYKNKSSPVKIKCMRCAHIFTRTAREHIGTLGCPKCKPKMSLGERRIMGFLIENNIQFEREKTFDDLRGSTKFSILRFDFYLPDVNAVIEFDGAHHFVFHAFNSDDYTEEFKKNVLEKTRYNDSVKNKYCADRSIRMVRIAYHENLLRRLNHEFTKS